MTGRVLIPSSEHEDEEVSTPGRPGLPPFVPIVVLLVTVGILAVFGSGEDADPAVESEPVTAEPASPTATVALPTDPLRAVSVPGRGAVVARLDVDGTDTVVTGSRDGISAVWQEADGLWELRQSFDRLDVRDAVVFGDRLVVTGRSGGPDRARTVYVGSPGQMEPVDIPFADDEYGYRLEAAGGALLVFTRTPLTGPGAAVGTGALSVAHPVQHSVMWSTDGKSFSRLVFDASGRDVGVFDVLATDDGLRFYGSAGGRPAGWILDRRLGSWVPEPEIVPGSTEGHRVVSVVEFAGMRLALVVDGALLTSTEVWEVTGRAWERLAGLGSGVFDDLVVVPGGIMAIPESGVSLMSSTDGLEWTETTVRAGEGVAGIRLTDARITAEDGLEVFGLAVDGGVPTIWSETGASLTFELPENEWEPVERFDIGDYIFHLSDSLQLVWDRGVVSARPDWSAELEPTDLSSLLPVFDLPQVAEMTWGQTAVAVSASRSALVVSEDGLDWEMAVDGLTTSASGPIPVLAVHDHEAMVLSTDGDALAAHLVSASGTREIDVPTDTVGDAFGWVDGLGYTIVETRTTTTQLFSTLDGEAWWWSLLWDRLESPVVLGGRLVGRSDGSWVEYLPGRAEPRPFDVPGPFGDGLLSGDGPQAIYSEDGTRWLTDDLETWHRLEVGFAGPAFGYVGRAWLTESSIVVEAYHDAGPVVYRRPR